MTQHIFKSSQAPPGIYKHVLTDARIQVDWQPYKGPRTNAYTKVGEFVIMTVNAIGWVTLAFILFIGLLDIVSYQFAQLPEQEVTIEQAE